MGVWSASQGSPWEGDREAAVGATILSDQSKAQGRQNGGAPPSLTRRPHAHHPWNSVSQPPPPLHYVVQGTTCAIGLSYRLCPGAC